MAKSSKVEIPSAIALAPQQSLIDSVTMLYEIGGIPMVEAALIAVMEVVYPSEK